MSTNDSQNPDSSKPAGTPQSSSMKERLLAERRAQQEAGGAAAPAPKPVPAARPAAARPAGAPAAGASQSGAARPARPAPRPAAPAAPEAPADPKLIAKQKQLHKPIPGGRKDNSEHPDIKRDLALLRQRDNKLMMIAWIVCGVLVLGAGGTYLVVKGKQVAAEEAVRIELDRQDRFLKQCQGFDLTTTAGAEQLVAFTNADMIDGIKVGWQNADRIDSKVRDLIGKAQATVDRLAAQAAFAERVALVASAANDAGSKTPEEIKRARTTLKDLQESTEGQTDEMKTKLAEYRLALERVYVTRMWDTAKALEAKGQPEWLKALVEYGKAEQACLDLFEKRVPDPTGELVKFAGELRPRIYEESDALCAKLFTPEYINQQPWTDLLGGDMAKQWQDASVEGFDVSGGVLKATGPAASSGKEGLVSIPKQVQWRDFQLEVEFEVTGAQTQFFLRLLRRADNAVEGPKFVIGKAADEDGIESGKRVTVIMTCVGNELRLAWPNGERTDSTTQVKYNLTRKGGFGATVPPGTSLKITKARVRILRPDSN